MNTPSDPKQPTYSVKADGREDESAAKEFETLEEAEKYLADQSFEWPWQIWHEGKSVHSRLPAKGLID